MSAIYFFAATSSSTILSLDVSDLVSTLFLTCKTEKKNYKFQQIGLENLSDWKCVPQAKLERKSKVSIERGLVILEMEMIRVILSSGACVL